MLWSRREPVFVRPFCDVTICRSLCKQLLSSRPPSATDRCDDPKCEVKAVVSFFLSLSLLWFLLLHTTQCKFSLLVSWRSLKDLRVRDKFYQMNFGLKVVFSLAWLFFVCAFVCEGVPFKPNVHVCIRYFSLSCPSRYMLLVTCKTLNTTNGFVLFYLCPHFWVDLCVDPACPALVAHTCVMVLDALLQAKLVLKTGTLLKSHGLSILSQISG